MTSVPTSQPSPAVRRYCEQRRFSRFVRERGFDYLLPRWERIVSQVCQGYRGIFPEFLNDMDARQIIHVLLPLADDVERAKVQACVPGLDEQFLKATRPIDRCICGDSVAAEHHYDADCNWWYYRVPNKLDCESDLDDWLWPM